MQHDQQCRRQLAYALTCAPTNTGGHRRHTCILH
jgi:hypothetical protein